jgi:hypothetical protein
MVFMGLGPCHSFARAATMRGRRAEFARGGSPRKRGNRLSSFFLEYRRGSSAVNPGLYRTSLDHSGQLVIAS